MTKTYCDACIFFSDKLVCISIVKNVAGLEYKFNLNLCPECFGAVKNAK